uniref:Uncharacterized protein n=1 Tax=Palpitomonas bilix TaxID=652834 RepID=A0A7S3D929_9EUKA|mmetsp:Transcript_27334/g.70326  ORF Transcript_27334/g.70326 Transcript_27334/m.70326 type:complete len:295 (+) Transcript_27334:165-1049(+)
MAESEDDSAGRGRESLPLSEILAEVANSILGDSTLGSIDLRYSNLDGGNDELSALRSPSSAKFSSPQRGALQVDGEDSDIDGERSESVSGTSERHQESAKKKIHLTSPSVASGHQSSALMSPVIGSTPVRKEEEAVKNIPFFEDEEEEEEEEKNEKLKKSTSESDLNRDLSRRPTVDANGKTPPRVSPRAGEAAIVEEDEVNTPADEEEGEEGSDMGTGALEVTTEDEDAARSVQIVRELAQLVVTSEEKLEREQKEKEKLEESVFELKEEVQGLNQLIEGRFFLSSILDEERK